MLNAIRGVDLPDDAITRRPSIGLALLADDPAAPAQFETALDRVRRIVLGEP